MNPFSPTINLMNCNTMRRMGPVIRPLEGDISPEDSLLLNAIVDKAKDYRDFKERDIRDLVYLKWITHDDISIKKKMVNSSFSSA